MTPLRLRAFRSRYEVQGQLEAQVSAGRALLQRPIGADADVTAMEQRVRSWSEANVRILREAFRTGAAADAYGLSRAILGSRFSTPITERTAAIARVLLLGTAALEGLLSRVEDTDDSTLHSRIFIGHGRSPDWRELKEFLEDRLRLPTDEFNRTPVAGRGNTERLGEMLDSAALALLVLTAEDERRDGGFQARQNVIHEAGLFQGRLGWTKAIILLEEGCEIFSNVDGLGHIPFPSGRIKAAFEDIRLVVEREGLIPK